MGNRVFRLGLEGHTELAQRQRAREQQLVRQMRADRDANIRYHDGVNALGVGNLSGIFDTILGPTPEQLSHGCFEPYQAETVENTAVSITTLRRQIVPQVLRLHYRGLIDADQLKIVIWYRNTYDQTGLTGNIPSTDYMKEVFASPDQRLPFSQMQCEAQDDIRFVRVFMDGTKIRFFDAVVLDDMPLSRAKEWLRCRNGAEGGIFKHLVVQLVDGYKELTK